MDEISKQIEEMADRMEKSTQDPKESLFAVIKSLGPAGLKAKLASLSDEEKVVLKAALEEMTLKKAVEFDREAQSAKPIQGKVTDTIIQEEIASDDADEKLVKPAAAQMNHQGTPTDGWSGQVIKSIQENDAAMDQVIEKAMDKTSGDDKMVMKKLKEKGMDEGKVQGALDRYKQKQMKKAEDEIEKGKKEEAAKKLMAMEAKEHGTKDPKKLVEAEKKEHAMKKAEDDVEKGKKMNKEEDQLGDAPEMKEKPMGKKTAAPDIEDNAKANKKNMTKSCTWEDPNHLLKANRGGRNHNFNLEHFVTETLKTEQPAPDIKKADKKEDLNDIIEKGGDCTWGDLDHARLTAEAKQTGKLVKSFDDVKDIAASLGISEEEARKILGE